jgi:hypothetical protein
VTSGVARRAQLAAGLALVALALLTGCARPAATPTTSPTTPLSTSTASSPSASAGSPGRSESLPSVEPSEPTDGPSGGEESDKPPVLDRGATGRSLTTADFFAVPDQWADGRFDVAGQRDLAGVGGPLSSCEDEAGESSATIELRLANNFTRLSMKVGQSDDSRSSDSEVNVKVLGNGKYLDTVRVPFNKIANLQAPVTGVNALKLQIWMGGENCTGDAVEAVLMDLRVE